MSEGNFKDHFSKQAVDYAKYRPSYPEALFLFLKDLCQTRKLAWDGATGNGQAALSLVNYFDQVVASDASAQQLAQAKAHPRIDYRVEPAEKTSLLDASVDLVTVAQAIHWFKHDLFYQEVQRVIKSGGVLALWVYGLHHINDKIDPVTRDYYSKIVGPFWPPERKYIEEKLQTLPFPFKAIKTPKFFIDLEWDLEEALQYFRTWSATQKYQTYHQKDPVALIEKDFSKAWGDPQKKNKVSWPLYLRVARL
ncbi:MAG: methyltransferase domain-containing protein [Deltaproteobacteria bacterium]|nr:methyltransferase domain-containing protein [Deltaproteobacteria bacterium]